MDVMFPLQCMILIHRKSIFEFFENELTYPMNLPAMPFEVMPRHVFFCKADMSFLVFCLKGKDDYSWTFRKS